MHIRCRQAWAVLLIAFVQVAGADEVLVRGSAPVRDGDLGQARELATRRALARAAESRSATVNSQTAVRAGIALESAQVSASACTQDVRQVGETVLDGEMTVGLRVTVLDAGACKTSCQHKYVNKIVVSGFALEFPEQLLPTETSWLANLTAVELARALGKHGRLLVDHDGAVFPYRSPSQAPEPFLRPDDKETLFSDLARTHRGQYVLSGVYRDFGLRSRGWGKQSRRIEIDAFLHDGANGAVLARRNFAREASGAVTLTNKPTVGSSEFYAGDLGRTWGALLEEISLWAEENAACLPFMARVLKTDGSVIQLDAGAESGLSPGDTLNLHVWREPPVRAMTEHVLGQEKYVRATAVLKHVYPRFSVAELIEAPKGLKVQAADLLYTQ